VNVFTAFRGFESLTFRSLGKF